ncbi:hypothetical protein F0562_030560 [Nyssa sinensis]|uniref:Legume lectin domain-containing protein n=1 Tax=Nyssa sinensis TaxID=561372 RepID=A0A5J5AYL8_9ASTE|nr:hypothetical protein F0562_030560 [Nyssa sinensis]
MVSSHLLEYPKKVNDWDIGGGKIWIVETETPKVPVSTFHPPCSHSHSFLQQETQLTMLQYIILLFFFLKLASSNKTQADFAFSGKHKLDGLAHLNSDGRFMLKNSTTQMMGHAFYNFPIQFKNHTNGSVPSFSTTFIFAMEPDYPKLGGHGIAFVISPSKDLKGAMPSQYLGLFNSTNDGYSSNHVVAVELDAIPDFEFNDINGNHVGLTLIV